MPAHAHAQPLRRPAGADTRTALIAAGTEVFLDAGFRAARVEDIARLAGQRLSAINYHFGSKEGLYLAVLEHHADLAVSASPLTPPDAGMALRARFDFAVQSIVGRVLGRASASQIGPLMLRELVNPTPALDVLFAHFTQPQAMMLRALLVEVLGPRVPAESVGRALASVFGQCAAYVTARPLISRMMPELLEGEDAVARTASHIANFSWAGLQALRAHWEA